MRAAIYARVSTTDQNCEMQLAELRPYILSRGWEPSGEYVDTGWSGAKLERPELDRLFCDARKRKFDVIVCWKLDRFGRSLYGCKTALESLKVIGIRFIATSQNIDTDESNPASRFFQHILMAAAEFERELIRERAAAGQKRYRTQFEAGKVGKDVQSRSGKNLAVGRPRRVFDHEDVMDLRKEGLSPRRIARRLRLGEGTVRRVLRGTVDAAEVRQKPAEGAV